MALKKFHLIKDRFLHDDYESGLYFDLCPVKRPAGDEDAFNAAIEAATDKLVETDPANQVWKPTLFLTEAQMYALPKRYQDSFSAKTYLLLFKTGFTGASMPLNLWFEYGSGGLVCNPSGAQKDWLYYTNWDANMLGHRFRVLGTGTNGQPPGEVTAYVQPGTGGTTPPPAGDEEPGGNGDLLVSGGRLKTIHIPAFDITFEYEDE